MATGGSGRVALDAPTTSVREESWFEKGRAVRAAFDTAAAAVGNGAVPPDPSALCKSVVLGDAAQCDALIAIVATLRWSERRRVAEPLDEPVRYRYAAAGVAAKSASSKSARDPATAQATLLARRRVASAYNPATVEFVVALRHRVLRAGCPTIEIPPHCYGSYAEEKVGRRASDSSSASGSGAEASSPTYADLSLFELLVGAALLSTIVALREARTVPLAPASAAPGCADIALPPRICAAAASLLLNSRVGDGDDFSACRSTRLIAANGRGSLGGGGSTSASSGGGGGPRSGGGTKRKASAAGSGSASGAKSLTLTQLIGEWISTRPFAATGVASQLAPRTVAAVASYAVLMGRDLAELRSRAVVTDAYRAMSGQFWIGSLVELHGLNKVEMNGAIGTVVVGCEQIDAAEVERRALSAALAEAEARAAAAAQRQQLSGGFNFVEVDFSKGSAASGVDAAAAMLAGRPAPKSSAGSGTAVGGGSGAAALPPVPVEPVRAVVRFAVPGTNKVKTCAVKSINLKEALLSSRLKAAFPPSALCVEAGKDTGGGQPRRDQQQQQRRNKQKKAKRERAVVPRSANGSVSKCECDRIRPIAIAAHFLATSCNPTASLALAALSAAPRAAPSAAGVGGSAATLGTLAHLRACDRCKRLVGCGGEMAAMALAHAAADSFTQRNSLDKAMRDLESASCVCAGCCCAVCFVLPPRCPVFSTRSCLACGALNVCAFSHPPLYIYIYISVCSRSNEPPSGARIARRGAAGARRDDQVKEAEKEEEAISACFNNPTATINTRNELRSHTERRSRV